MTTYLILGAALALLFLGSFVLVWIVIPDQEPQRYWREAGVWLDDGDGDWNWAFHRGQLIFSLQAYLVIKFKRLLGKYHPMLKDDAPIKLSEYKRRKGI
jgi:hypothetical protein